MLVIVTGCPQTVPEQKSFAQAGVGSGSDGATGIGSDAATSSDGAAQSDTPGGGGSDSGSGVAADGQGAGTADSAPGDAKAASDAVSADMVGQTCANASDCGPAPGPCQAWQCVGFCYPLISNSGPCDDGDACTTGDVCFAGACQKGPATSCDDKDPCTTDSCAPATGCSHAAAGEGAPCGGGKTCNAGVCGGGVGSGVLAVSAAGFSTCAIAKGSGKVFCWGDDAYAQVGTGATQNKWFTMPQPVVGLGAATAVDCGGNHCCAITQTGLFCWGHDQFGQVSGKSTAGKDAPTPVQVMVPAKQIAVGEYHTCALDAGGTVRCWGLGSSGQLGDGNTTVGSAPVVAKVGASALQIDCGATFCCAVVEGGTVSCWGLNMSGQIGTSVTGPSAEADVPTPAKGVVGATLVAAGKEHACALVKDGGVMCWGANNSIQTGSSGPSVQATPKLVSSFGGATALAAGGKHTCAVADSKLYCWGENGNLQAVPTSKSVMVAAPTGVEGIPSPLGVALGDGHTCVHSADGSLRCWGANNLGQVGDGTTQTVKMPFFVQ